MKFAKENPTDIIIGLIAIGCLVLSSNLFGSWMPSGMEMLLVGIFISVFALFAVLIWRERPRDEREAHIQLSSDRLGFLAGAVVLAMALVVTSSRHESTNLLALILSAMILAKLLGKYINR